ncbi:MAG TPA: helix-turn-helix domain-containing protein [Thermomicrobiales bacterium]|nr:helix-turn-helix domain-containing protein [Thermomicrobiales bacterium]
MNSETGKRGYQMVARAEAAAATAERIMDAAVELFLEQPSDQMRLDEVAARAGVTVQTVLRRFGSKEGLFSATVERESTRVRDERGQVAPGDVQGAIANLVEHYEELGDLVIRLLAEEDRMPGLRMITDRGRALHRDWCQTVFEPFLAPLADADRGRRLAQLVAICDVYTWKLLRRDQGLSRVQTELALVEMLAPFTKEGS